MPTSACTHQYRCQKDGKTEQEQAAGLLLPYPVQQLNHIFLFFSGTFSSHLRLNR